MITKFEGINEPAHLIRPNLTNLNHKPPLLLKDMKFQLSFETDLTPHRAVEYGAVEYDNV